MGKFTDLNVWKAAHAFVLEIYQITKKFPEDEKYALISQMRRAAVSIPANIAEGTKRRGGKDKNHFLNMANASLEEVKYYLILSEDLEYCAREQKQKLTEKAEEIGRMLSNFSRYIESH